MNIFRLGLKNLFHKPWSTALSLTLAALGAGLISLLLLINHQFQEKFDRNLAGIDLVIGAKGSPLQLILSSMYHVDAPTGNINIGESKAFLRPGHPLIETAVPLSLGDNHRGYRIVGTSTDILPLYEGTIKEGRTWEKVLEVTAGATVAQKLGLKVGDTFKSGHGLIEDENQVHEDAEAFKVVGILEANGSVLDQLLLTANASMWAVHDHGGEDHEEEEDHSDHDHEGEDLEEEEDHSDHDHGGEDHEEEEDHSDHDHEGEDHDTSMFSEPLVSYEDKDITSILIQFKGRNFQALNMGRNINENTNLQAATPAIEINRLYSNIGAGERILRSLMYIIVGVSILSIFISLYSSLSERRYELALMRVMGAGPGKLMSLILLEGLLLATLGCLIGIVLSHLGMAIFAQYLEESYRYTFDPLLFLKEEVYLIVGAIAIGLISALIPAIIASKTAISETLSET